MRSLQLKFSALVVAILVIACVGLAWMATRHERLSLEGEVGKRGISAAGNLAEDAKIPLLEEDQLALDTLVQHVAEEDGVVAVRLVDRDGTVLASLAPEDRG